MLKAIQIIRYIIFLADSMASKLIMQAILKSKLKGCRFHGIPSIELHSSSSIDISENTTINSRNTYYHLNMHSKCKLISNTTTSIIKIGRNTRIHGSCIHAKKLVAIGDNVLIAANCQILDNSGHLTSAEDPTNRINTKSTPIPVKIEDAVWIGANSIILPGVTIGRGSIIAAGSVVTKSIPSNVLAGGNPAKVIKPLTDKKDS